MREILFKAKRKLDGMWVIGDLSQHKNGKKFIKTGSATQSYEVDENTICQYTGLTDKNGNKIWENDVVLQKTTEKHWCKWECMGVVKYGENDWNTSEYGYKSIGFYIEPIVRKGDTNKIAYGLNQDYINDEYYPIEVIGNIFDNPELLKGVNEHDGE